MKRFLTFSLLSLMAVGVIWADTQHKVKSGETLQSIATHYGLTVDQLKAANPKASKAIYAGMTLTIPSKSAAKPQDKPSQQSKTTTQNKSGQQGKSSQQSKSQTQNNKSQSQSKSQAKSNSTSNAQAQKAKAEAEKAKAEAEKAKAEAELAKLKLEQARKGNSSGSSKGSSNRDLAIQSEYRGYRQLYSISPTIQNHVYGLGFSWDIGAVLGDGFFLGGGPRIGYSSNNSKDYYELGVGARIYYAFPTGSGIRPYIDGNIGENFEIKHETFSFGYGYSVGVQFRNGSHLGLAGLGINGAKIPNLVYGFGMPGVNSAPRPKKPIRHSGFELTGSAGYIVNSIPEFFGPNLDLTFGYRLSDELSIGAGISYMLNGGSNIDENWNFYARGQYRLSDGNSTPFGEVDLGYTFYPNFAFGYHPDNYRIIDGNIYLTPRIGYSWRTTSNSYFFTKFGYKLTGKFGREDPQDQYERLQNGCAAELHVGFTHVF